MPPKKAAAAKRRGAHARHACSKKISRLSLARLMGTKPWRSDGEVVKAFTKHQMRQLIMTISLRDITPAQAKNVVAEGLEKWKKPTKDKRPVRTDEQRMSRWTAEEFGR